MKKKNDPIILFLSVPMAILTAIVSFAGIFIENTYARENALYAAQGIGQDIVNLFIVVPVLLVAALFAWRKNKLGLLIWSGIVFYLAYSYTIYSFGLHFNNLFIAYCSILGLSFYSLVYYLITSLKETVSEWFAKETSTKSTGIFLIIIAVLFYFIWLSEIIPATLANTTPKSITESGLLVNPVHVLDIAICLPALFITGIALIKKKNIGFLLAPTMMIFCIFMAIAIAAMVLVMKAKGLEANIGLTIVFGLITLISSIFLLQYLRKLR
ncbi:MAG: hypothetical protein P4L34_04900 [Paludibacter sp.]|nr:hypothetical protein [Paludibacter sp.]